MKKIMIALTLTSAVSTSAQAAFWDSWFSSSPAETTTPEANSSTEAVTNAAVDAGKEMVVDLIPLVTQQLGVSKEQANGGMGALFHVAKENLSTGDFSQLSQSIPDMSSLLAAAPQLARDSADNPLGDLLAQAGSVGKTLNELSQLKAQFDALGLNTEMMGKFATIAIDYLQNGNEKGNAELLQKGLGALMGQ